MASELFVDNITGKTGTSGGAPITLSGDTATLGTGVTVPASIGGSKHLIQKQTASSVALLEFTSLGNHSAFTHLEFVFSEIMFSLGQESQHLEQVIRPLIIIFLIFIMRETHLAELLVIMLVIILALNGVASEEQVTTQLMMVV